MKLDFEPTDSLRHGYRAFRGMVSVLSWAGKRFENRESKAVMLSGYHFQVGNFVIFSVRRVIGQ